MKVFTSSAAFHLFTILSIPSLAHSIHGVRGKVSNRDNGNQNKNSIPSVNKQLDTSQIPAVPPNQKQTLLRETRKRVLKKKSKDPTEPETEACLPSESFLIFSGHNEASSTMYGALSLTWSPAFVFHTSTEKLIWCGDYTYDVFVAWGHYDYTGMTSEQLLSLASTETNINHYTTTDTHFAKDGYLPGDTYSVLVTARTDSGIFSTNRYSAKIEMATQNPQYQSNFKRLVNFPETSSEYGARTVEMNDKSYAVFSGTRQPEMDDLEQGDMMYVLQNDGTAILGRCVQQVNWDEPGAVGAWEYEKAEMGDIFDEVDISVDVADTEIGADLDTVELDPDFEQELEGVLDDLPVPVRMHLCKIAYPDREEFDCYLNDPAAAPQEDKSPNNPGQRRQLFFFRRLVRAVAKVVTKAVQIVKTVAKAAVDIITTGETSLEDTFTFLDVDTAAKVTCSKDKLETLEIGVNFDASAHLGVKITLSITSLVSRASAKLFGWFGIQSYIAMQAAVEGTFTTDPKTLFTKSKRKVIVVGIVPVVITLRPNVKTFMEASISAESAALLPLNMGWDYEVGFEFDQNKSPKFDTVSKFNKRPPPEENPIFDLRVGAEAAIGVSFAFDLLLFEIIQGTIASDLGFKASLGVGTNLDAIAVTSPFFYTLDELALDFFVRVRSAIGFNEKIGDIIDEIKDNGQADDDESSQLECTFDTNSLFEIPDILSDEDEPSELPAVLSTALEKGQNEKGMDDPDTTLTDLLEAVGVVDLFQDDSGELNGLELEIGLNFEIFREDFTLLSLPEVSIHAASLKTCQGPDAIVLHIESNIETKGLILKGLRNGEWFANFDGNLFGEDTPWELDADRFDHNQVTMRLPRSAIDKDRDMLFEIPQDATVLLRATPQLMPFPPKSMFVKKTLLDLFQNPPQPFECCQDSDCDLRNPKLKKNEENFCNDFNFCKVRSV